MYATRSSSDILREFPMDAVTKNKASAKMKTEFTFGTKSRAAAFASVAKTTKECFVIPR